MTALEKLPSGRVIETPVLDRGVFYDAVTDKKRGHLFDEVVALANSDYEGIENITPHFTLNSGSNLALLILTNKFLAQEGLRTPTAKEGLALHDIRALDDSHLVDYGAALHTLQGPNVDSAAEIVERARKGEFTLPAIFHPEDLTLNSDGKSYSLVKSPSLVISGEEAKELLSRMYVGSGTGFQRLSRIRGDWGAVWYVLFNSGAYCRVVDRVRGEAARADLQAHEKNYLASKYGAKQKELTAQLERLTSERTEAVNSLNEVFTRK